MKRLLFLLTLSSFNFAVSMQRIGMQGLQSIAPCAMAVGGGSYLLESMRQYGSTSRGGGLFKPSGMLLDMNRNQALKLFGIQDGFDDEALRTQYKKLAKKWHPDLNRDNPKQAEAKFKELQEAYGVLQQKVDSSARNNSYSQGSATQQGHAAYSQDDFATYQEQKSMFKARGYSIIYQGTNGFCRAYKIIDDKNGKEYTVHSKDTGVFTRSYEVYDDKGVCIKSFTLPKAGFVLILLLQELERYMKSQ